MADTKPKWSAEELGTMRAWLKSKRGDRPCATCGSSAWGIGEYPAQIPVGTDFSRVYPFWVVFCSNCGRADLYNALLTGVRARSEDDNG